MIQELAIRGNERIKQTLERKSIIEKVRIKRFTQISDEQRQMRLKTCSLEKASKSDMLRGLLLLVFVGVRANSAIKVIQEFRDCQNEIRIRESSVRIITR